MNFSQILRLICKVNFKIRVFQDFVSNCKFLSNAINFPIYDKLSNITNHIHNIILYTLNGIFSSHFLLAQILPDGESHCTEPGPGAWHVTHHCPGVLHWVITLYGVVISEIKSEKTKNVHYLHKQCWYFQFIKPVNLMRMIAGTDEVQNSKKQKRQKNLKLNRIRRREKPFTMK